METSVVKEGYEQSVGKRVRTLIDNKCISVCECADLVGVDERTLRRYIRNEVVPSRHNLKKLADVLGVAPDYILTGKMGSKNISYEEVKKVLESESKNMNSDEKMDLIKTILGG